MRWRKSSRDWKGPPEVRLATMARMRPRPTFFTAPKPKRMPSGSTVNLSVEWLMSGGKTGISISLHSAMYPAIFPALSKTEVISAAIYWRG